MPGTAPPITSLGRVVAFNPIAGSYGFVTITGTTTINVPIFGPINLNVARWTPDRAVNPLPVTNFNSAVDGNNTVHDESIPGVMRSTFTITGVRDSSAAGYHPTPGDRGVATLGYDATHTFTFDFFVVRDGGEQNIEGVAALEFQVQAVGLCLMAGRTSAA